MSSQIANAVVAKRLQQARERAGYDSADQVAAAFGWPDYASDEKGEGALSPVRARLYAHAFHVDLDWLMSGDDKTTSGPDSASDAASVSAAPANELADRIDRLSAAQQAALLEFLRSLQED